MKLPILGYFDLHNRELHGSQQVSTAFFLLQSYVRGSRRPQVDGNRAANTHGNLPPTNERQMCTIHFLNPSQTLSLTTRDSRALRQPPVPTPLRGGSGGPGRAADGREHCASGPAPSRTPRIPLPLPSRPQPRWRRGRSQRGRLGAGPRRPHGAEGRCQAGGCPGVRRSGPSAALRR